ncbi:hypothetical protein OG709_29895 [Streptomyces sp. NBC_01267]|uniref:hypothetical protein n=1 Tax=Streptomyces sp. NBC_01267 TaxID=2903805 RepID=UPI002E341331|nr:hypothetical protein [Streptomyces sp. NBC_01267]
MPKNDNYLQNVPYPVLSDAPNIETATSGIVNSVVPLTNMTFSNSNARAAAVPRPVDGMETYLVAEQRKEVYVNGTWQEVIRGTLGWANVALPSGYRAYVGSTIGPRVRRVGPIVYLEGRLEKTSGSIAAADSLTIGTVPTAYRPVGHYAEGFVTSSNAGAGTPLGRIEVWHTDGTIRLWTDRATPWVGFSAWWFVT